jgi:hypothetical protein
VHAAVSTASVEAEAVNIRGKSLGGLDNRGVVCEVKYNVLEKLWMAR